MWSHVVPCGLMWSLVVPCGPLWSLVVPCGPFWSLVVPCGPLWSHVVPCGPLWSLVVPCGLSLTGEDSLCRSSGRRRFPGTCFWRFALGPFSINKWNMWSIRILRGTLVLTEVEVAPWGARPAGPPGWWRTRRRPAAPARTAPCSTSWRSADAWTTPPFSYSNKFS